MNTLISSIALIFLFACSSDKDVGFGGGGIDDSGGSGGLPETESIWSVDDRGLDLISYNGLLYASTQAGGAIWSYDPETEVADRIAWDLGDLQAIAFNDDEIYASFTDSHVEGWVATIEPPKGVDVIASKTDSGTLFRRPAGLAFGNNDELYVLDIKDESIWKIDSNGSVSTFSSVGGVAIFYFEGSVYVGGDDGIFEVTSNSSTLIDSRPAFGFEVVGGALVASSTYDFVFEVGGEQIATGDLARPGAMATLNGVLYIMDTVTGKVSAVDLN